VHAVFLEKAETYARESYFLICAGLVIKRISGGASIVQKFWN